MLGEKKADCWPVALESLLNGVLGQPGTGVLVRSPCGRRLWRNRDSCCFVSRIDQHADPLAQLLASVTVPGQGELSWREQVTDWRMTFIEWPGEGQAQLWTFKDRACTPAPPHPGPGQRRPGEDVRMRQALEEAQGKLRLLSAHTRGILFEFDSQARFVRVWASDEKLLLMPEAELLGRTLVEALGPDMGRWHHERVCHTLHTGEEQAYEYRLDVPNGASNFACTSVPVPAPDGIGRHAVFWIRDVTEEVELRARLQRADRLAAVGTMAAGVAHEVNNPLTYMRLNLDLVLRELRQEQLRGAALAARLEALIHPLEMVKEGAERVHTIVAALLNLARPTDANQVVDVRQTMEHCLELTALQLAERAVVQRAYANAPKVCANEARLIQVFTNLLSNAADAMADSQGERTIHVSSGTDARGRATVEIRDSGAGIASEHLARVFDPFFTTKPHGLGLGLAICQRIIASFGGEIQVESTPGQGAAFRVSLPAMPASQVAAS